MFALDPRVKVPLAMISVEDELIEAAKAGNMATLKALLDRGIDPNTREKGDNTHAMHWAAAAGNLDVVKLLADKGGDVIGEGDDHALEVIGWATCWDGCDDDAHRSVAEFLITRGARHHIFSAIAMNLEDEVRRIVEADRSALTRRMSRNENNQLPIHFAVRMNRPEMVALLLELGADPLGVDRSGMMAPAYALSPDIDRPIMTAIRVLTEGELLSAERGNREPNVGTIDLLAAISLGDWDTASTLRRNVSLDDGLLHLMAKRGDIGGIRWLLKNGANPNALWAHWDSELTPLHLAILGDHVDVARLLLQAGADRRIRDSKHDSDALGWAEFLGRRDIAELLR